MFHYEVHHDRGGIIGFLWAASREAAFVEAQKRYAWAANMLNVQLSPANPKHVPKHA